MHMASKQRGLTLMSFIIVMVVVAFFAVVAMKLFPVYNEYNSLRSVMKELAAQPNSASLTQGQIAADMDRRFNIAYVESVKKEHIKVVRGEKGSKLNVAYEVRKPLFFNLDVVAKFDHTVDLSGPSRSD
jgi:Tfp pilus assembly protein PilE